MTELRSILAKKGTQTSQIYERSAIQQPKNETANPRTRGPIIRIFESSDKGSAWSLYRGIGAISRDLRIGAVRSSEPTPWSSRYATIDTDHPLGCVKPI